MSAAATIFQTELKLEWRNPSGVVAAALFALLTLLTQALAFPTHLAMRPEMAFAAFFISSLFAGLLAEQNRLFRDRKTGVPHLLALAPASSAEVFSGKCAATCCLMGLIQLVLLPFLILFFNLSPSPLSLTFFLLCALADLALAGLTTLFGAATYTWRGMAMALALPILLLPLSLPILAAVSMGASGVWTAAPVGHHIKLLLAANLAIGLVGTQTYGKLVGRI